jgi:DNA-binding NarL/FixJ family response regulator
VEADMMAKAKKIRVLLADDHNLFRQGLRQLLEQEDDIEVVGEAGDGLEVQRLVAETNPDIVLMDINMPLADGVSATREIMRTDSDTGIIILTMYREEGHVFQAVQAGARGYLLKSASAAEVVSAVRAVHSGASSLDPEMASKVLEEFRRLSTKAGGEAGLGGLTERELALLRLVASGLSNKEIARNLYLSESTVKNRLSIIFEKIGAEDRTQAAIYAITHGLLPQKS